MTQRWSDPARAAAWQTEVRLFLGRGYAEGRKWSFGVSLFRRLALAMAFTLITDRNWRAIATSTLILSFLLVHLRLQPFATAATRRLETVSLLVLGFLSISTSPQAAQIEYGLVSQSDGSDGLGWVQFTLAVIPAMGLVWSLGVRLRGRFLSVAAENDVQDQVAAIGNWAEEEPTSFLRVMAFC